MNRPYWSAILALAIASSASAHHSFAGYNLKKTNEAEATIKEFRWGAPHSAAILIFKDKDGKPQTMMVSSASPAQFLKRGFKIEDFKPGDKVHVTWFPTNNGNPGGFLSTIRLPDGRTFKDMQAEESSFKDVPE